MAIEQAGNARFYRFIGNGKGMPVHCQVAFLIDEELDIE